MGQIAPVFGSIIPSQTQLPLANNYLAFNTGGANANDFAQQYLPEVYEAEVERYGNRTLSGFLKMVGAEMPMTSDQVIWSEQNRLHISYTGCTLTGPGAGTFVFSVPTNAAVGAASVKNAIAPNDTIVVMNPTTGVTLKGVVGAVAANGALTNVTAYPFTAANWDTLGIAAAAGAAGLKIFVYGSLFAKGTGSGSFSVQPQFTQYSNQPIIIKDRFEINGSDMAQIGWVEVATEDGTSGYLWYLKSESETRLRFDDYLEMAMVEGELADANGGFAAQQANVPGFSGVNGAAGSINAHGTEGLFQAITNRGNIMSGFQGATGISDFDQILKNLDTQGAIEENMLFLSRATALDFDDMIAAVNGGFASTQAASFGLFENDGDMALNFGFSGFRRGSYDFYKTDWKYLNDASTRGLDKEIDGVLVPAGTSTVYDQMLGSNIRRPFLHVRYRASETEDRRFKNWITGSVGGAYTSDLDAMTVNFLSERCLVTQAANNFVLFKGA